ncbi:MAG TPA: hypothetical protein VFK94_00180 [Patescibacteria group bacterium]|nr:hypothetical protein [Patescibacteria group bacterium]
MTRDQERFKNTEPATRSAEDQRVSLPSDLKKLASQRKKTSGKEIASPWASLFDEWSALERMLWQVSSLKAREARSLFWKGAASRKMGERRSEEF